MIVFKTGLSSKTTNQLNKFTFKKIFWLFILISVLCVFMGVIGIVAGEDAEDRSVGIGLIAFGVLYAPVVWFGVRLIQKHTNKTTAYISDDTVQVFKFEEERCYIEQERGDMFKASLTAAYSYFYKVKETATHYFIYSSSAQVFVAPKADIVEGTVEELNAIFAAKLGKKFKRRKR